MTVVSLETIRIQKQEEWNEAREVAERYFQHLMSLGWGVYRIGEALFNYLRVLIIEILYWRAIGLFHSVCHAGLHRLRLQCIQ